jgi:PKD domain-containing protein/type IX secretion system substrate protein
MKALTFTLLFFTFSTALFATQQKKTLTLRLLSPTGNSDETTIYFDEGITPGYNVHEDATYIFTQIAGVPEIYSYTLDKVACSINGAGTLQNAQMVNLGYHVGYPGLYTITGTIDNFDPTSMIRLVDNKTGDTLDLRENFLQVQLDSTDISTNRFQILFSSSVKYTSLPSNCSNSAGSITITPDSTIVWSQCQLIDSSNQVLQTYYNVSSTVTFTGLAEGTYQVVYTYNDYTASNYFYLNGNFVVATIGVPAQQIYVNQDVIFDAVTANADHFNWDFGDSTLIIGVAHPTQRYLIPGTYTVNLYAYNDLGCSASAQATVTVLPQETATGITETAKKEVTVIAEAKLITINMNGTVLSDNAQVQIYNLLGQSVKSMGLNAQTASISLDNQANGYYLVSIRNGGSVNTKRIFIAK